MAIFDKTESLEDPGDDLSCRSFSAKEPLTIGLFCGKRPITIWVFVALHDDLGFAHHSFQSSFSLSHALPDLGFFLV